MARTDLPEPADTTTKETLCVDLHPEKEVSFKYKLPKFIKGADFYQFTLRFADWSHLTGRQPHHLLFLSCIQDDATYMKLHSTHIPIQHQSNPDHYLKVYLKGYLDFLEISKMKLYNAAEDAFKQRKDAKKGYSATQSFGQD